MQHKLQILFIIISMVFVTAAASLGQQQNDEAVNATLVTHEPNWTSIEGIYSNAGTTGNNFQNTQQSGWKNVWFKFIATSNEVQIKVLTGGTIGSLTNPFINVFNSSGERIEDKHHWATQQIFNLTIGQTYYFSIDGDGGTEGTFTLQVRNVVGYDNRIKAELLNDITWQSVDGVYTNVGATGSSFDNVNPWGGFKNVWFKFVAASNEIHLKVLTGGTKGTLQNPFIMVFNSDGVRVENNVKWSTQQLFNLTPGQTYYFSIDGDGGTEGTFTVQINDPVSYDNRIKAEFLTNVDEFKSADAAYTNVGATGNSFDNINPWGGFKNVWFKFQAPTNEVEIKLLTGGLKGSLPNGFLSLYNSSGVKLDDAVKKTLILYSTLSPGETYYFSVDGDGHTEGSFTIEVDGGRPPEDRFCDNIFCDENGGVGIGTQVIPAGFALAVNGSIISQRVKVQLRENWPDYVFDQNYKLISLTEVEKYIKENGHLPELPSAKQVKENGIDIASMDAMLLQKIEELTLYMIELKKENESLKKEMMDLRNKRKR